MPGVRSVFRAVREVSETVRVRSGLWSALQTPQVVKQKWVWVPLSPCVKRRQYGLYIAHWRALATRTGDDGVTGAQNFLSEKTPRFLMQISSPLCYIFSCSQTCLAFLELQSWSYRGYFWSWSQKYCPSKKSHVVALSCFRYTQIAIQRWRNSKSNISNKALIIKPF